MAEIGEGTGREMLRGIKRQRNLHCAVCTKILAQDLAGIRLTALVNV